MNEENVMTVKQLFIFPKYIKNISLSQQHTVTNNFCVHYFMSDKKSKKSEKIQHQKHEIIEKHVMMMHSVCIYRISYYEEKFLYKQNIFLRKKNEEINKQNKNNKKKSLRYF